MARNSVSEHHPQHTVEARELTEVEKNRLRARRTPPRKWADRARTQHTAEYQVWYEANRRWVDPTPQERGEDWLLSDPFGIGDPLAHHAQYFPEEHDKEIGDGAWVFVIDPPVTALGYVPPLLSLWWARPHVLNVGPVGGRLPYQAVIQTPHGDLHLWPHEYTICRDPKSLIGLEGCEIHTLGGEPLLDPDRLFYLMSRGIPRVEAVAMLWDEIETGDYAYVTFPEEAVEMFAGLGTRARTNVRERYLEGALD